MSLSKTISDLKEIPVYNILHNLTSWLGKEDYFSFHNEMKNYEFRVLALNLTKFKEKKKNEIGVRGILFVTDEIRLLNFCTVQNEKAGFEANKDLRIPQGNYFLERTKTSVSLPKEANRESFLLYSDKVGKERRIICPHIGNWACDTKGCILIGKSYNNQGITSSTQANIEFLEFLKPYNNGIITIIDIGQI